MKNYILTDFNSDKWEGIDLKLIETEISIINEKIKQHGQLYGEIKKPNTFDISFSNVSHYIKNITMKDGIVYGDVEFLKDTKGNGKLADDLINNKNVGFGLRYYKLSNNMKILTWDIKNND